MCFFLDAPYCISGKIFVGRERRRSQEGKFTMGLEIGIPRISDCEKTKYII